MKLLLKRLASYFPTSVPTGMTKFDAYLADIIELVGPIASPDDIEWVLNAEMMRIEPKRNKMPKNDFVRTIKVAAAKQLAGARFQALKMKQEAAAKAQLEAQKQQEATATEVVAPVEQSEAPKA